MLPIVFHKPMRKAETTLSVLVVFNLAKGWQDAPPLLDGSLWFMSKGYKYNKTR